MTVFSLVMWAFLSSKFYPFPIEWVVRYYFKVKQTCFNCLAAREIDYESIPFNKTSTIYTI